MSIKPQDLLHNKKDLTKIKDIKDISLDNITIDDLTYDGQNYDEYINLNSFLNQVSSCQISDAFNQIARRSGVLYNLKSINNLKTWGRITTSKTNSDDWGTITLAIDEANDGDVLLVETSDMDAAIWGELAST
jgi:3-hexulose-6-phosphate synthase